jgi:Nif-specific regulatory protein
LESELFGYEKGAFTGADSARAGKIELANAGTLFLDEIESISVLMQSKLLRVLEDQEVQRLGSGKKIKIDMRVIAATNIPLEALLSQGKMRSDFYYRINVVPIQLIPLRERREDIPLLVDDFLRHHSVAKQKGISGVSPTAMNRLIHYHWPGNIRELQNVLEKALVLCTQAVIQRIELTGQSSNIPMGASRESTTPGLTEWLLEQERQYIIQQLKSYNGKIAVTAKSCGLGIRTLSRKMRLYGLRKSDFQKEPSQLSSPANDKNVLNSKISSSVRRRNS